jgi:uncharacterized membrane-anchored protein
MKRRAALGVVGFVSLAALQLGIPISMLASREMVLRGGEEVRLAVVPRDPRSLTRGDYSALNYAIAHFDQAPVPAGPPSCPATSNCALGGRPIYVTLSRNADGMAQAQSIDFVPPPAGTLFIKGTIRNGSYTPTCTVGGCFSGNVNYGIEQWFGPQGVPAQIDRARAGSLTAVARIAADGTAVLALLLIDGKPAVAE